MTESTKDKLEALRDEVAGLVGSELLYDYTMYDPRDGLVVDAYVAQADIDKGITIRGAYPYKDEEPGDGDDVDIRCINIKHVGAYMRGTEGIYMYTLYRYLDDIMIIIEAVKQGVFIRKPEAELDSAYKSTSMQCAF